MRFHKTLLTLVAATALLTGCGSKMTEEQINAKVDEQFNAQRAAIEAEMDNQCSATFDAMVQAKTDAIVQEKIAAATAQQAAQ